MEKPKLRIIHNMARSGSTLMSKCLGCMDGVILLSEVHPKALGMVNPLKQAREWFALLTSGDITELNKRGAIDYKDAIALIEQRCSTRGDNLVLRDWTHFDYTGYPYNATPSYSPRLYTELADSFDIIRISTARDPVTQWQSLTKLHVMQESLQSGVLRLDQFLVGYRKYAELCIETGFVRYEDFVEDSNLVMRKLCEQLEIKFDPSYINKWYDYRTITGDTDNPHNSNQIKALSNRSIDQSLREKFLNNADYHRACELLGYTVLEN